MWVLILVLVLFEHSDICFGHELDDFAIYDALKLSGKPDIGKYGIRSIGVIYTAALWLGVSDKKKLPCKKNVLNQVNKIRAKSKIICLDIEHWPTKSDDKTVNQSIKRLSTIIQWIKTAYPDVLIGYYSMLPVRDYWRALRGKGSIDYKKWQKENDKLKLLASSVDIIFPSIYTFYNTSYCWVKYAQAQINEAKRYGKPVVAFIWPYYHGSNKFRGGKPLSNKFWQLQLETLKKNNVGIVIWASGSKKVNNPNVWDENAGWWLVTKKFAKNYRNCKSKP